ncbi:hypothetical protein BMS3Abin03_01197 [bacterium BMS3Abin03]|nr:hypothetical protein BMS3Abin03_01197 [bacterium BMS3Abin03]
MSLVKYFIISAFCIAGLSYAQPELDIKPNKIEFEDIFNRLKHVHLINTGDVNLTIDSLQFNPEFYLIDFANNQQVPFTVLPGDSVMMNVLLSGFQFVQITDTTDTIYVFNNGENNPGKLSVKIDFFEDEYGKINGIVDDGVNPLEDTYVYFYYEGIYLLDTALTDVSGSYSITLPEGDYTIAAEHDGYYVTYFDNTFDPFFATELELESSDSLSVNFSLTGITDTNLSVSGSIFDSTNIFPIYRGIVVVRKGTHVPYETVPKTANFGDVFSGLVRQDGSYKIYMAVPDYYYIQAYTDFFLPGYFNEEGNASVYWIDGDSVLIDNTILNKNINLVRDSSYGGGLISGSINFAGTNPVVNYDGITLLARSIDTEALYTYNFGKETGTYGITNIPYGTYEVVAQKIGFENAFSQIVTIDPLNNQFFNIDVSFIISDVNDNNNDIIPQDVILYPSYPNPFNPSTNISFTLPEAVDIKLQIVNILGETIKVLLDSHLLAGNYNYNFAASGLVSGVYIIFLQAGNILKTQKIILLK